MKSEVEKKLVLDQVITTRWGQPHYTWGEIRAMLHGMRMMCESESELYDELSLIHDIAVNYSIDELVKS